jgi:hypothetical protein
MRHAKRTWLSVLLGLFLLTEGVSAALAADSEAEFKAAYALAAAAEKEAGNLHNQWTVTEASLTEARTAADKGDFERAVNAAKQAEALARASIFQATHEKEAWKDLEIR